MVPARTHATRRAGTRGTDEVSDQGFGVLPGQSQPGFLPFGIAAIEGLFPDVLFHDVDAGFELVAVRRTGEPDQLREPIQLPGEECGRRRPHGPIGGRFTPDRVFPSVFGASSLHEASTAFPACDTMRPQATNTRMCSQGLRSAMNSGHVHSGPVRISETSYDTPSGPRSRKAFKAANRPGLIGLTE